MECELGVQNPLSRWRRRRQVPMGWAADRRVGDVVQQARCAGPAALSNQGTGRDIRAGSVTESQSTGLQAVSTVAGVFEPSLKAAELADVLTVDIWSHDALVYDPDLRCFGPADMLLTCSILGDETDLRRCARISAEDRYKCTTKESCLVRLPL